MVMLSTSSGSKHDNRSTGVLQKKHYDIVASDGVLPLKYFHFASWSNASSHLNKEQHEALAVAREFIKGISAEGLRYCHKVHATFRGYCTIVKGKKAVSP